MITFINNYLSEILVKYRVVETKRSDHTNEIINGSYSRKNSIISQSITVNGETLLSQGVIVQEMIVVNGSLNAKDVAFESDLTSNGNITLINAKIKGHSFLRGEAKAYNSVFVESINLLGHKAYFEQCKINNLIIKPLPSKKIVQEIHLTNKTIVEGDIVFESRLGKVYVDASSKILGSVRGGDLIRLFV